DARSSEVFKQGHIAGARNLPWEAFDKRFDEILSAITPERDTITYCDGESCNLSHELAITLKAMGFSKVKVLVNGWTVWQEAGLPIESGPDGGKG
ncbi:MAG: rhodanese-like domain-containing protein, partial [Deltaproteobacteria bacterium]|nr:rhodanese-like domain-containing protein [Deltaproteobacteria bacterium]